MARQTVPALLLDRPGEPVTLRLGEIPMSDPSPGQVRIRVQACGLNPVDAALCVMGVSEWIWPHVPGLDVVGLVDAVGSGADESWLGRRVAVHHDLRLPGGLAGVVCVDADMTAPVPEGLDGVEAATAPCPGLTADQVVARAGIGPGRRVLIRGAGGAVGSYLTQLALATGAQVDAIAAARDMDRLLDYGVDRAVDYRDPEVGTETRGWTDTGYDVVADLVGSGAEVCGLVAYSGVLVSTTGRPDLVAVPPFTTAPSAVEIALGAVYPFGSRRQRQQAGARLVELLRRLADGELRAPVVTVVSLAEVPATLQAIGDRSASGKFVAVL